MPEPVRGGPALCGRPEATVLLPVGHDHRVVHLARLEGLRVPAEELGVELLRLLRVTRVVVVPDEGSKCGLHRCAHTRLLGFEFDGYRTPAVSDRRQEALTKPSSSS